MRSLACAILLFSSLAGCRSHVRGVALDGTTVEPLKRNARAVVLVFVATDCPVSNGYAPELQRIEHSYSDRGVAFHWVYPGANDTAETVRAHLLEYGFAPRALRDPWHELARAADASVTPEAAVFVNGQRVYHGRIDNRFVTLGVPRQAATQHELIEVLDAVLSGRAVTVRDTPAVGCYLPASR